MYEVKRKIILTKDYFDPEEKSIFSYNGGNYCRVIIWDYRFWWVAYYLANKLCHK